MTAPAPPPLEAPLHVFRFGLAFAPALTEKGSDGGGATADVGFAECTGLEATMEPKVIKEGGRNYGAIQRAGPVTFATVILKRGLVRSLALWEWFTAATSQGSYGVRRDVTITLNGAKPGTRAYEPVMTWELKRALPIKFKAADLNARGTEVGIEELQLAHEGLRVTLVAGQESPGESPA